MKLNSSMCGSSSSQNLAHQFYYYIPHPSLPYVENNLSGYGKDLYSQPQNYAYDYGSQSYYPTAQ
jgi:hypothetical protein